MRWLTPLGFLGAIGIVLLVIIYIIKPNYQNKRVSSTFIWQLSLRYKKHSIPISKIQNLITFLCQLIILTILTVLLASPVFANEKGADENEAVIVIDASAGMRIFDSEESRFIRAAKEAYKIADEALDKGSRASVIIADAEAEFLFSRKDRGQRDESLALIDGLITEGEALCSWGSSDVTGAMALAESVLDANSKAKVYLISGSSYTYHNGVTIVPVASEDEWNAAILDCKADLDSENHYEITVSAACRGKTDFITVYCAVHGVNGNPDRTVLYERGEFFDPTAEEKSIVFKTGELSAEAIYSYDYIEAYVALEDSLGEDNSFFLYEGKKPVIKIQYASSSPNNFFESAIRSLRQNKREIFDISLTFVEEGKEPALEGFDFYIFEHKMPDTLPKDGVVLLCDPDKAPGGSGLEISDAIPVPSNTTLSPGETHELTRYTTPGMITVAKYNNIILSEGYTELMHCGTMPVMLLKDTPEEKIIVWAIDLNYSNLIALPDFSILMYNAFNYFFPRTVEGSSYEVGSTVSIDGRGTSLKVTSGDKEYIFENGRGEILLTTPGTYEITQVGMGSKPLEKESFFVKIPADESNPERIIESVPSALPEVSTEIEYRDIVLYLAIALVALMFAEWVLEIKKNYR